NNKAPACESRGFVLKKKVCFLTHLLFYLLHTRHSAFLISFPAADDSLRRSSGVHPVIHTGDP
nr:hypothetical protein [Parabacteroides sp. AD58]